MKDFYFLFQGNKKVYFKRQYVFSKHYSFNAEKKNYVGWKSECDCNIENIGNNIVKTLVKISMSTVNLANAKPMFANVFYRWSAKKWQRKCSAENFWAI